MARMRPKHAEVIQTVTLYIIGALFGAFNGKFNKGRLS